MQPVEVDWSSVDTVLLDMDGTLLDLRFDNWFWQEHIPALYAAARGLSLGEALRQLEPKFHARRGTLAWYCIDFWSDELNLDIASVKRAWRHRVGYLPGAEEFLTKLKASGKRRILVTNAHPVTMAVKIEQVGLAVHFDECYSAHAFELPKENANFWPRLQAAEPFSPAHTLFIDDSLSVLVAAQCFGIKVLRAVRRPDSGRPPQATGPFLAIDGVAQLFR